jgi:molybdopterin-guanine dinucleotide biosynthesis protein A
MGTDKAFVEVEGVAMAERVARALVAGGCEPVAFVGGDSVGLARFGRPTHADRWPGEGPLGGVLTALSAAQGDDVVVAACDLPFLDGPTVRRLVDTVAEGAGGAGEVVDVVVARTERLEPALAWWRAAAAEEIARRWDHGLRALHEAIGALRRREVAVEGAVVRNVNRPSDLPP